jgi:hypothetical protein
MTGSSRSFGWVDSSLIHELLHESQTTLSVTSMRLDLIRIGGQVD